MQTVKIVLGAAVLALALAGCKNVTPGTSCDQVGSQHTNEDGTLLECIRNVDTGKGFWRANP